MAGTALHHITGGNPESLAEILSDGTMLGNNPDFIRLMAQVGSQMQERGLIDGEAVNSLAMTPDEAQQRLSQLMADPEKSAILFSQDFHPAKAELVKRKRKDCYLLLTHRSNSAFWVTEGPVLEQSASSQRRKFCRERVRFRVAPSC